MTAATPLVVGGVSVALTLMLGGTSVQRDVFAMLWSIYVLLLAGRVVSTAMVTILVGVPIVRTAVLNALVAGVFIVTGISSIVNGHHWPIRPHTSLWWDVITLALVMTLTGAINRHSAESALETLQD